MFPTPTVYRTYKLFISFHMPVPACSNRYKMEKIAMCYGSLAKDTQLMCKPVGYTTYDDSSCAAFQPEMSKYWSWKTDCSQSPRHLQFKRVASGVTGYLTHGCLDQHLQTAVFIADIMPECYVVLTIAQPHLGKTANGAGMG